MKRIVLFALLLSVSIFVNASMKDTLNISVNAEDYSWSFSMKDISPKGFLITSETSTNLSYLEGTTVYYEDVVAAIKKKYPQLPENYWKRVKKRLDEYVKEKNIVKNHLKK